MSKVFNISVVGGAGHIGLPLSCYLQNHGHKVTVIDKNQKVMDDASNGIVPFEEIDFEDNLNEALKKGLKFSSDMSAVAQTDSVFITLGTSSNKDDIKLFDGVIDQVLRNIKDETKIILRSTVTLESIFKVKNNKLFDEKKLFLSYCPERIAEGLAYKELKSLPQVVGGEDEESVNSASELFSTLAPEILKTDFITAELVKLFNNISRYINFAVANQFALIADDFGANIYETRRLANHNYPRCNLAMPGFTAGTCLRKDFGMINEWSPYPDMLLSAWKMNEFTPAMLVEQLNKRAAIHNKRVAVMGFTFKADTDDIRDSLVPKLCRYIERKIPFDVRVTDHHLPSMIDEPSSCEMIKNWQCSEALEEADCVFVATNHTGYKEELQKLATMRPNAWIADIWNVGGIDQIFYKASDLIQNGEKV